jgi:hypothetical protein
MYLQKEISRKNLEKIIFLRLMTKIAGSGFISQRHGSGDPDPHQNGSATLVLMQQNIYGKLLKHFFC